MIARIFYSPLRYWAVTFLYTVLAIAFDEFLPPYSRQLVGYPSHFFGGRVATPYKSLTNTRRRRPLMRKTFNTQGGAGMEVRLSRWQTGTR